MSRYDTKKIENKWQKFWAEKKIFQPKDFDNQKPKFYHLVMFPYPSGDLHIGHWYNFAPADTYARFKFMQGYNVLSPIGFDAFGLPAENAAIKRGINPRDWTDKNIAKMRQQLQSIGAIYDWSREVVTADPSYYKWTQWLFIQLYKNGLAYRTKAPANWCPSCQTVLANEQVVNGHCERCSSIVEQKPIDQWLFKITSYAERLLNDLEGLDWPEKTKLMQRNWIGKSVGATIKFKVQKSKVSLTEEYIEVFTTRPDTIFGATYLVLSPEHPLLRNSKFEIRNSKQVENYVRQAQLKTERERQLLEKEKTGVELQGIKAVNPATGQTIPIWVADYVLMGYGTGAIMAVPAHDRRDFEFAKKYGLPIIQVIRPAFGQPNDQAKIRKTITAYVRRKGDGKFLILRSDKYNWYDPIIGGIESNETPEEAAIRETKEETGLEAKVLERLGGEIESHFFAEHKKQWRHRIDQPILLEVDDDSQAQANELDYQILWLTAKEALQKISFENNRLPLRWYLTKNFTYEQDGVLYNSKKFNGQSSNIARESIVKWLAKKGLAQETTNYRLRDWLISRQRYWGCPIPIIYCRKCWENSKFEIRNLKHREGIDYTIIDGLEHIIHPAPDNQLPVELPVIKNYLPEGKPPLATATDWLSVKCPVCGQQAIRETETMDTFVDSSWYFLRYLDPKNNKEFANAKLVKFWAPPDIYIGGAEHSVLHLLYARFFTKVLYDLQLVSFNEPFPKLRHQGTILGVDRTKMSKSRGNVIDPDELVKIFGSDTVRMFLMFMGPYDQGGPWSPTGIAGISRFLMRLWKFVQGVGKRRPTKGRSLKVDRQFNRTIQKVTDDLELLHFNTAIARLMTLFKSFSHSPTTITRPQFEKFLKLLAPFAPHLSEELWQQMGNTESIFRKNWIKPKLETQLTETLIIPVQVNGKLRGQLTISPDTPQDKIVEQALAQPKIRQWLTKKRIKKTIYIPSKILNLVLE